MANKAIELLNYYFPLFNGYSYIWIIDKFHFHLAAICSKSLQEINISLTSSTQRELNRIIPPIVKGNSMEC